MIAAEFVVVQHVIVICYLECFSPAMRFAERAAVWPVFKILYDHAAKFAVNKKSFYLKELTNWLSLASCQIHNYVLLYFTLIFPADSLFQQTKKQSDIHSDLHAVIRNKWTFTGLHCLITNYTLKRRNDNDVIKAHFQLRSDKPLHNHWYCN